VQRDCVPDDCDFLVRVSAFGQELSRCVRTVNLKAPFGHESVDQTEIMQDASQKEHF
jgi:hypothetical protein